MKPSSSGMSRLWGSTCHPRWPPEMSPLLRFFLIYSFLECYNFCIWLFTALGFAPLLWTFCVVPFLVVYWLCDHSKLWQAVREIKRSRNETITLSVALISIFLNRIQWGLFFGCVFCLFKAFSFEKMMYMSDVYGEIVKSIFWKVASRLVEIKDTNRLSWKGGLAYCSPYSRKLVRIKTDVYYTLKPGPAPDQKSPDSYKLEFNIEACRVMCKYSTGGSKDTPQVKVEESSAVRQYGSPSETELVDGKVGLSNCTSLTATDSMISSHVNDIDAVGKEGVLSRSPSFTSQVHSGSPSFNSSVVSLSPPVRSSSSPVNVPGVQHSRSPSYTSGMLPDSPSHTSSTHSRSPSLASSHSRSHSLSLPSGAALAAILSRSPSHHALSRSPSVTSVSGSAEPLSRSPSTKSTGPPSGSSTEQDSESPEKSKEEASYSLTAANEADDQQSPLEEETSNPRAYGLNKVQLQKLEASLWHGGTTIEGYTYYQVEPEAVMEVKRVLEILRDRGNLIFSDVHRNVGSRILEAHARCYDFEELLYLIIHRGYRLHMVNLLGTYTCHISGSHVLVDVIGVVLTVFILFYQLSTGPKPIFYILLGLYIIWQLVQIAMHRGEHRDFCLDFDVDIAKRGLFYLIRAIADPGKISTIYGWLHEKLPFLTFSNESYGHPFSATGQEEICLLFVDECTALPIVESTDYELFLQKDLPPPLEMQRYDLKNLQLEMTLRRGDPTRKDVWKVEILMQRSYDDKMLSYWFRRIFVTEGGRVRNLIAIMEWLVKHDCVGVCKEWPQKSRIRAYQYLELFTKVLQEGVQPWIIIPASRVDLTVE